MRLLPLAPEASASAIPPCPQSIREVFYTLSFLQILRVPAKKIIRMLFEKPCVLFFHSFLVDVPIFDINESF